MDIEFTKPSLNLPVDVGVSFSRLIEDQSGAGKFFTGVGSRDTPADIGLLMAAVSQKLTRAGWTLRSGGADGADLAFESGADSPERQEIFLPYPGFNGSKSTLSKLMPACYELASQVHPAWDRCSDFAKKAHARNAFQVMGYNLMRPADMVICWTKDGAVDSASARNAGGTRTAIVMASNHNIPVFNLKRQEVALLFSRWVGEDLLSQIKPLLRMKGPPKKAYSANTGPAAFHAPSERPVLAPAAPQKNLTSSVPQAKKNSDLFSAPAVVAVVFPANKTVTNDSKMSRIKFRSPGR